MKKTIRSNVFETNSSSVHTLSIDSSGMEPCNIPRTDDNRLIVDFGVFDKEGVFSSQQDKLSYLITCMWYNCGGFDGTEEEVRQNYVFKYVEEAVCEYSGASGIYIPGKVKPYIDHQSVPEYSDDVNGICSLWSESSVCNFVFNKYISLECDCD